MALGVPTRVLAFVEENDLFFDPVLGSNVRVARHAVSIDEKRGDFVPTFWDPKESADLKQVWFAGVHSDVGAVPKTAIPLSNMRSPSAGFDHGIIRNNNPLFSEPLKNAACNSQCSHRSFGINID